MNERRLVTETADGVLEGVGDTLVGEAGASPDVALTTSEVHFVLLVSG